jgi:lipopolysaccharide transport system ATP-binding protein
MMVVEVKNLSKTFKLPHERKTTLFENLSGLLKPSCYETITVLQDISFSVERGESVGIIGDNGSGKSTLLKVIANILRPTRGELKVHGRVTPFLELGVGFQPDLTVRENVGIYAAIMGVATRDIERNMEVVLDFAGLKRFEDAKLKNLSSGMQVRLAFSTAMQTDPDILLVDEVLAVGDMEFQQQCLDSFERYKRDGVTILFVSHDLGAVRRFCDKTLLLINGRQVEFGETNQVIDRYIYKEQKEVEKPAQESDEKSVQEGEEKPRRWGNKKLEILDVKFIDKDGKENNNFVSGDPFCARMYYDAHEPIPHPIFGIVFYSQDTYCYGTTTELKKIDLGVLSGRGYIDFFMERMSLNQGQFHVTVAIAPPDYLFAYDFHDRLYSFHVHNRSGDLGIFNMEGVWRVNGHD